MFSIPRNRFTSVAESSAVVFIVEGAVGLGLSGQGSVDLKFTGRVLVDFLN